MSANKITYVPKQNLVILKGQSNLQTFEVIFIFSSRPIDDQWMILFSPKFGATWSLFQNVCSYETFNNP